MNKKMLLSGFLAAVLAVGMFASPAAACFTVVVGKKASSDGAVLLGHNEQNDGQRFLNFRKIRRIKHKDGEMVKLRGGALIPQVKETYTFFWSQNPGLNYSDAYLNEWGVAVVSNGCPDRGVDLQKLEDEDQLIKGGISYMLRRLIAERAKTARQGVQIAAKLIEQMGYPSSRTLVIADSSEAWLLSMSRGKHWVAQRVPDDSVVLLPNVYIIGEVNLKDKANFFGSPDLIKYAIKNGWYDPADGKKFSFWRAYGQPRERLIDQRQWRGQCLVTGKQIPQEPDRQLPFSVRGAHKLSVKDVITILRYHGKGGLCNEITQEAAVFQLRSGMPVDIGCIYWRNSAEPCTGVLTPWYCGTTAVPEEYHRLINARENLTLESHFSESPEKFEPDDEHAWWVFKKLQDKARADYANRIETVRATWDRYEAKLFANQPAFEKEVLEMYNKDKTIGTNYLTTYSRTAAFRALRKARELTEKLK